MDHRLSTFEKRSEEQDKKLDQILEMLNILPQNQMR
jgi:hypothetical protein